MRNATVEPTPCTQCGHLVYPPLLAPVRNAHQTCRAMVSDVHGGTDRCGCSDAVHRVPTVRPRHRFEAVSAAS